MNGRWFTLTVVLEPGHDTAALLELLERIASDITVAECYLDPTIPPDELAALQEHDDQYGTCYAADLVERRRRGIDYGPQFDEEASDD